MGRSYVTVYLGGSGLYEEKKSRFLSYVYGITSLEEAEEILAGLRKEHYDARHCCYAYALGPDGSRVKCSDDGEPQKTAGAPILSVIQGEGLTDTLIAVVRYFGGTLLGTGGLVRAYTEAAKDGLRNSTLIEKTRGTLYRILLDYQDYGQVQYYLAQQDLKPLDIRFSEKVEILLPLAEDEGEAVTGKITDMVKGRALITADEKIEFGRAGNDLLIFHQEEQKK